MPFRARFPGICDRCNKPFGKNDLIVTRRDDHFIHQECASGYDDE
jgi:hypothetical protein